MTGPRPRRRSSGIIPAVAVLAAVGVAGGALYFLYIARGPHPTNARPVEDARAGAKSREARPGEAGAPPAEARPPSARVPEADTSDEEPPLAIEHTGPGEPFDLQGFIDKELAAGKKRITLPPGRHRVTPRKRQHLLLADLEGVEIDARGAEMVCTETTRALTVYKCRDVTVRRLTIDYDPLPFTQGRIVSLSDDGLVHDIDIFEGYPPPERVVEQKYEIFRPDTRTLRFGSYYGFKVEKITERRIRVTKADHYRKARHEKVGDIVAIAASHSPGGQIPHAVYCEGNVGVTLEDVTLYASNCFGFLEVNCSASVYRRCRIDRRPGETDLKPRGDARIRSLNADAYHSKHAVVGPSYIECTARFMGDDCVAINRNYYEVQLLTSNVRLPGSGSDPNRRPRNQMRAPPGP
ncbi:MAG: hypothetical protein ACYTKD_11475 [Planctomycetota bacterium]|jgi:hypothetical protein